MPKKTLQKTLPTPFRAAELGLSYRPASDSDRPLLARIYASTRADEVASTGWSPEQQQQFLQMQFEAQDAHYREHYPDALWLVIQKGILPAGRLYLEDWTRELRIIDIAILPEFRGKGWGEAILRDLMDATGATERNVSIHVEKTNPAMRLYTRLGFKTAEDKGVYDLMVWSADADAYTRAGAAENADAGGVS
ncbi:MAG: GNAT family N-acetyltransferase [Pseudomonadota bacterium]